MKTLYINGKFLAQRTTGVQRFARGIVAALDAELTRNPSDTPVVLLKPHDAESLSLRSIEERVCGARIGSPTLWEQTALPQAARNGALLCLAGSAPLFGGLRLPTIHDAAVYLYPQAYSKRFVAWYRLLFKRITAATPLAFTVSANAARELEQQLPGRHFRVVYNASEHILGTAADRTVLEALALKPGAYLLAVGSQNPTKNLAGLIAAYAQTGLAPRIPLVIVGGGNAQVFASTTGQQARVPGVLQAGALSDAALRALYENATAFVFPSLYEGFGLPPLEAMSCACPVLASNAASIPEICAEAALYFDPRDPAGMAAAMRRIVEDAQLRHELVAKGLERRQAFSWARSATTLRTHLQSLGLLQISPSLQAGHGR